MLLILSKAARKTAGSSEGGFARKRAVSAVAIALGLGWLIGRMRPDPCELGTALTIRNRPLVRHPRTCNSDVQRATHNAHASEVVRESGWTPFPTKEKRPMAELGRR